MTKNKIKTLSTEEAATLLANATAKLDYDPITGRFSWRRNASVNRNRGRAAGSMFKGYLRIRLCGLQYYAHPLAWLISYGKWPTVALRFADGDRGNIAIANLSLKTDVNIDVTRLLAPKVRGVDLGVISPRS